MNVPVETNINSPIDNMYSKADKAFKSPIATQIQGNLTEMTAENQKDKGKIGKQAGVFAPLEVK